jgi:hypothetical protein
MSFLNAIPNGVAFVARGLTSSTIPEGTDRADSVPSAPCGRSGSIPSLVMQ